MAWVAPIVDRTQTDIDNKVAKAYWNVSDFTRLDGNIDYIQTMRSTYGYCALTIPSHPAPSRTITPNVLHLNNLILAINIQIADCGLPIGLRPSELEYWEAGTGMPAPNFMDANSWEQALLTMYTYIPMAADYAVQCGVGACGPNRMWQSKFL